MLLNRIAEFFLPAGIRNNKSHPRYQELYNLTSMGAVSAPMMALFPLFLLYLNKPVTGYYINVAFTICLLFSIKWFSHYRIPMILMGLATYFIVYGWIKDSGLIYSSNAGILHLCLLITVWSDKRYGWWSIFGNLAMFYFLYYQTVHLTVHPSINALLGSPLYAFGVHGFITVFFGVFLAYEQYEQDRSRRKIRDLQDKKISQLDEAVTKRTEQLNTFRQAMATDFHDQTGNMLSAISSQANVLKLKLAGDETVMPILESIISNSNELYNSSKDFLWNLNHNSDDPREVFYYLTGYGQVFYNQFNIAFSSGIKSEIQAPLQLEPFAALNLIFIFKEGMTNVVKHAGASEVFIEMEYANDKVVFALQDNGKWKAGDEGASHYGLRNIERRCEKNNFGFLLSRQAEGTRIEIKVPVKIESIV